jgi:hypothetical protein
VAKPNYSMAKRQRDLAKKAKAEEKRLRKAQAHESGQPVDADGEAESGAEAGAEGEAEAADGSPPAEA